MRTPRSTWMRANGRLGSLQASSIRFPEPIGRGPVESAILSPRRARMGTRFSSLRGRCDDVRYWIDGRPMTGRGLAQLGRYLDSADALATATDDMRALVQREFPQHAHKLPKPTRRWAALA